MATRKDFVALEQAIAAASVTALDLANQDPPLNPHDLVVLVNTEFATAIAGELAKVNKAFSYHQFGDAIAEFMEQMTDET